MPFFIIFLIIPLIEIALFIEAGEQIGILNTLLLCVLTAFIGSFLVRHQGLQTMSDAQMALNRGTLPVQEIFNGFCILAAGLMLVTPGFFTDAIGFSLLFPPLRVWLRAALAKHFDFKVSGYGGSSGPMKQDPDVIEGDFVELDEGDENQDKS